MAPNLVAAFVPQLLLDAIVAQLKTITTGAGYNTQPLVTTDAREWDGAHDKFALLVQMGPFSGEDVRSTPTWTIVQKMNVIGSAPLANDDPQTALNRLLQDALTALFAGYATITTATCANYFDLDGEVQTDGQMLADLGWASFNIPLVFKFKQGSTW